MTTDYNETTLLNRDRALATKPEQDIDINAIFFDMIKDHLFCGAKVLDIGTGNGFVLSSIYGMAPELNLQLYGVDSSLEMTKTAKKNLDGRASVICADCARLPFSDSSMDIVTAKNVTRIDAFEIARVLRPGGKFIFREYGPGKGLCEITEMFPGRIIRQRLPEHYIHALQGVGLEILSVNNYTVQRKYNSAEELVAIAQSFPFISDFSEEDKNLILERFRDDTKVTSDPFILVAKTTKSI